MAAVQMTKRQARHTVQRGKQRTKNNFANTQTHTTMVVWYSSPSYDNNNDDDGIAIIDIVAVPISWGVRANHSRIYEYQ